jgi:hypothetical protein
VPQTVGFGLIVAGRAQHCPHRTVRTGLGVELGGLYCAAIEP